VQRDLWVCRHLVSAGWAAYCKLRRPVASVLCCLRVLLRCADGPWALLAILRVRSNVQCGA
jgi:hypothetical protein